MKLIFRRTVIKLTKRTPYAQEIINKIRGYLRYNPKLKLRELALKVGKEQSALFHLLERNGAPLHKLKQKRKHKSGKKYYHDLNIKELINQSKLALKSNIDLTREQFCTEHKINSASLARLLKDNNTSWRDIKTQVQNDNYKKRRELLCSK